MLQPPKSVMTKYMGTWRVKVCVKIYMLLGNPECQKRARQGVVVPEIPSFREIGVWFDLA